MKNMEQIFERKKILIDILNQYNRLEKLDKIDELMIEQCKSEINKIEKHI